MECRIIPLLFKKDLAKMALKYVKNAFKPYIPWDVNVSFIVKKTPKISWRGQ